MGGEPGQSRMNPEVGDALLAAAYEWTKSGSLKERTSWKTEDALAMMAGGHAETKGELSVCAPSGFPEDVKPPSQSVTNVERSKHKGAWQEAIRIELDGHNTYEAATPPQGQCRELTLRWGRYQSSLLGLRGHLPRFFERNRSSRFQRSLPGPRRRPPHPVETSRSSTMPRRRLHFTDGRCLLCTLRQERVQIETPRQVEVVHVSQIVDQIVCHPPTTLIRRALVVSD